MPVVPDRFADAPPSSSNAWLLPPAWPLDGCHAKMMAALRDIVGTRAHGRVARRSGLLVVATATMAAVVALIGVGPHPHRITALSRPAATLVPAQKAVARTWPEPARAMPAPGRIAPRPVKTHAAAPVADAHTPWTDVSTMDLMMPIAEPDLDITSNTSLWSQIGRTSGIDPLLLYSVALVESKALYPDGKVAPTPWLFRVNDHLVRGDRHDVQLAMAAASQFGSAVQDVGIMQVYYPMHRDAVRDPLTLLNPRTNITVAARILRAGMRQTHDRVLGVGYYHSHTPSLARDYGTAVMTVYQRLRALHRQAAHRHVVVRS